LRAADGRCSETRPACFARAGCSLAACPPLWECAWAAPGAGDAVCGAAGGWYCRLSAAPQSRGAATPHLAVGVALPAAAGALLLASWLWLLRDGRYDALAEAQQAQQAQAQAQAQAQPTAVEGYLLADAADAAPPLPLRRLSRAHEGWAA